MQGQDNDQNIETVKESFGADGEGLVSRWREELRLAGKNDKSWLHRATKVIRRYRDERLSVEKGDSKYNVLWSNTETIKPALYYRTPKPMVDRRNKDREDSQANNIAKESASILERCLEYTLDEFDFDDLMTNLVEDYQLPGRAVAKVNYNPTFKQQRMDAMPERYDAVDPALDELTGDLIEQQPTPIYSDGVEFDDYGPFTMEDVVDWESADASYIYWKDFRIGKGKTWADVPWVAFGSDMSRDDLVERFGDEIGGKVPLNKTSTEINSDDMDDKTLELFKRARVWEIWDKVAGKVHWICVDYSEGPLDTGEPPLKFKGFYPCNRPLTMIENNGEHEPIPEFVMYQDQANELDTLTMRINLLLEAIKVTGVYDKNNTGIVNLLNQENENKLIGVSNWAMFAEKGGVGGAISWLPIDTVITTVQALYASRSEIKQEMYELTGIADIIRGASDARETAAAQQIKGKFASMRLQDKQKKVARAARDILRLLGEVISENFDIETIRVMSGMPVSEEAMQLLQNDALRRFTVSIETDSTIQPNEREEQKSRIEFLGAAAGFMEKAIAVSNAVPEFTAIMGQLLMFGMRSFRVGRDLEDEMEGAIESIKQKTQQQAGQEKPDPKMMEAQAKQQERQSIIQMKGQESAQQMQLDGQKQQQDMVFDQKKHEQQMQQDAQKHQQDMQINQQKCAVNIEDVRRKSMAAGKPKQAVERPMHQAMQMPKQPDINVTMPEVSITMPEVEVNVSVDANGDKKIILNRDKDGDVIGGETTSKAK